MWNIPIPAEGGRSFPTSCSRRWSASIRRTTGWAMAAASSTARWRPCRRSRCHRPRLFLAGDPDDLPAAARHRDGPDRDGGWRQLEALQLEKSVYVTSHLTSQERFMKHWPVQDAKARFSELLEASVKEGPQIVTRRGVETAVVVPIEEWKRLTESRASPQSMSCCMTRGASNWTSRSEGNCSECVIPSISTEQCIFWTPTSCRNSDGLVLTAELSPGYPPSSSSKLEFGWSDSRAKSRLGSSGPVSTMPRRPQK